MVIFGDIGRFKLAGRALMIALPIESIMDGALECGLGRA